MSQTGYAKLRGTRWNPHLEVRVDPQAKYPTNESQTMLDFMEWLGAFWMSRSAFWVVRGFNGRMPDEMLARAGIAVDFSTADDPSFGDIQTLNELVEPAVLLNKTRSGLLIRHRLSGYDRALELLGGSARWDSATYRFEMPVTDALGPDGEKKPGLLYLDDAPELAKKMMARVHTRADIAKGVSDIAHATTILDIEADEAQRLIAAIGDVPEWFGGDEINLFPYQRVGSMAVAAGHFGLFDEPGVGKSLQALAAASIRGVKRTLIAAPPVVLTHWAREATRSGLPTLGGSNPDGQVVVIVPTKKEPVFPDSGVVVVADSLLGARSELLQKALDWAPQAVILDEAHRIKSPTSNRARAMIALGQRAELPICLTGTPVFQSPQELVALLDFTGHLGPVFGGAQAFLERYCRKNNFDAWIPRKNMLGELHQKLREHVWVRRTKSQVLPNLPKKLRSELAVAVPLKDYREAHKNVIEHIFEWVERTAKNTGAPPTDKMRLQYAKENLRYVSMLRVSAAMSKVELAADWIRDFVSSAPDRPLIVWVHHHAVGEAMLAALDPALGRSGLIDGRTTTDEKDELVDAFQRNEVAVLVCSITAVGVGVTLTASSDHLFVETDWTPALVVQAEDRSHRVGATADHLMLTTMVALGTLDEHIQSALLRKGLILKAIYGDDADTQVAVASADAELETPSEIMEKLIEAAFEKFRKTPLGKRLAKAA